VVVTILGTLQFRNLNVASELKSRLEDQEQRLVALHDTVDGLAAAAQQDEKGTGESPAEPVVESGPSLRVLDRLKILAEERQLVIDEIKQLRGSVAELDTRTQQLVDRVNGIERDKTSANVSSSVPLTKRPAFRLSHTLPGHFALAFSPNGARLATSSDDNTALVLLGMDAIKRLATLVVISGIDDKPRELITTALVRAKVCELASDQLHVGSKEVAFTVGLFSVFDAMLDSSMDSILPELPVSGDVKQALLGGEGPYGPILENAVAYERGEWLEGGQAGAMKGEDLVSALTWATEASQVLTTISRAA